MKVLKLMLFLVLFPISVFSQATVTGSDTIRKDALNVYFPDADSYFKKEITFINYVRDIKEADVYLIVSDEETGSGGELYTVFMVGQNKYAGMNDTLKVSSSPDETEEVFRVKAVKILKMAFMRYMLKTPLAQFFDINFTQPVKETIETDKWKSWVYSLSTQAYSDGQKRYNETSMYASISANRITEKSKFQASIGSEFDSEKSRYIDLEDNIDTTYIKNTRDDYGYLSYVKSLNNHWSAGASFTYQTSIYNNYDYSIRVSPGIEYDIFPYSESTRRKLTFLYYVGVYINDYIEETTLFKSRQTLGFHSLTGSLSLIQKWGSVNSSLTWSNYFFNWSYNKLRLSTNANLRIFKGLSFNIFGSISLIHDQISLPRGGASLEDVLLNRKALETNYSYYTGIGFTYTFGSIYNNVVNPRFDD
jgi:hypothetical protein